MYDGSKGIYCQLSRAFFNEEKLFKLSCTKSPPRLCVLEGLVIYLKRVLREIFSNNLLAC